MSNTVTQAVVETKSNELLNGKVRMHMTNAKTELDQVLTNVQWNDEFVFAAGVNAITGETTGAAVRMSAPNNAKVKDSIYKYTFVRNESEMQMEFQSAVSGKYNIQGVDVKGSAEYLKKIQFNQVTTTLVAKYEAAYQQYDEFDDYELTPEAQRVLENDPEEFRKLYGDYFIAGGKRIARFTGVYVCKASTREEMDQFMSSFSGETPDVFSAEGSVRFNQQAKENNVSVKTSIFMEGEVDGEKPSGNDILEQLEWFKQHAPGKHLLAKLKHYCTVNNTVSREIDIAPDVFIELSMLYFNLWDLRGLYDSCPANYQVKFKEVFHELNVTMMSKQNLFPTDEKLRAKMREEISALKDRLQMIRNRMKFYYNSMLNKQHNYEPEKGELIHQKLNDGVRSWSYGTIHSTLDGVNLNVHSDTYEAEEIKPDGSMNVNTKSSAGNGIIVGWTVTSKNEDTHGDWSKDCDTIILGTQAKINVYGALFTKQKWELTVYSVREEDYQFND